MTGYTSVHFPYEDESANIIYNLIFGDDLLLIQDFTELPYTYPFDKLLAPAIAEADLRNIAGDTSVDPRERLIAYNRLRAAGLTIDKIELLGVVVEVHLEDGLDVLASFSNGAARYINYTGKSIVWETTADAHAIDITNELFEHSFKIINRIGPWDKPREPQPESGNTRITFLVSDGLYFGEAETDILFNDPMAGPALKSATNLMNHIIVHSAK
jgi:hypothetical protein